jgi:folylpolyglutamate synthase/dihydropteroate synthase
MKDYYMILALGIKKDYKNILKEIQKSKPALLCLVSNTNFYSHDSLKIKIEAKKLNINTKIYNEILDALNFIKKEDKHNKKKQVIITGSIGLVGSFISKLQ